MRKKVVLSFILMFSLILSGLMTAHAAEDISTLKIGYKDFVVWGHLGDAKPVLYNSDNEDITSQFTVTTTHLFGVMLMKTYEGREPVFCAKVDYDGEFGVQRMDTYYYVANETELQEEIYPNQEFRYYGLMLEISGPIDPEKIIVFGAAAKDVRNGKLVVLVQLELNPPTERVADISCTISGQGNGNISINMPAAPSNMKYVYRLASLSIDNYTGIPVGNARTPAGQFSDLAGTIDVSFGPSYYAVALIDKNADAGQQNVFYAYHVGRITPSTITVNISNISIQGQTADIVVTDNIFGANLNGTNRGLEVRGCELLSGYDAAHGTETTDFSHVKYGDTIYVKTVLYAPSVAFNGPYSGLRGASFKANVDGQTVDSVKATVTEGRDPYVDLIFPVTYKAPVRKVTVVGGEKFSFDVSQTGYAEGITVILTDANLSNSVMLQNVEITGTNKYEIGYDFISLTVEKSDITINIKSVTERNYLQYKDVNGNILRDKVYVPSIGAKIDSYKESGKEIYQWTGDNGKDYIAGDSFAFDEKPGQTKVMVLTEKKTICPVNHDELLWRVTVNGHERKCDECGFSESHKLDQVFVSTGADKHCVQCSVCHQTIKGEVDCLNDNHIKSSEVVQKGSDTHTVKHVCECGNTFEVEEAHIMIVKYRVEGDESTKYEECRICGATKECKHEHTELRGVVDASCITEGYSGDTFCLDCGKVIMTGAQTEKVPHQFGEWKDKTESGEIVGQTRECQICHYIEERGNVPGTDTGEVTTYEDDNPTEKPNVAPFIIGGIALAATAGTTIVLVKKKKK